MTPASTNGRESSVPTRYLSECEVLANDEVAPRQLRMRLHAPDIARAAAPGQFCMMLTNPSLYPFLRRPMCFERIFKDEVSILYKIEGEGTALMADMVPGQRVPVQGPLGVGFDLEAADYQRHIIVAGGIGVATFPCLAEALAARGVVPEVVLAGRDQSFILCADFFADLGCKVHVATDDGSMGTQAFACDMLASLHPGPDTRVYACGPMIMMKTTSDSALAAGADCVVSLEAQMACGDGACLGCVVESTTKIEGEAMVRVCVDGPVLNTTRIDWDAHNLAYAP
jgi:dihydroorotate dehydrogenase electron transfer subunit